MADEEFAIYEEAGKGLDHDDLPLVHFTAVLGDALALVLGGEATNSSSALGGEACSALGGEPRNGTSAPGGEDVDDKREVSDEAPDTVAVITDVVVIPPVAEVGEASQSREVPDSNIVLSGTNAVLEVAITPPSALHPIPAHQFFRADADPAYDPSKHVTSRNLNKECGSEKTARTAITEEWNRGWNSLQTAETTSKHDVECHIAVLNLAATRKTKLQYLQSIAALNAAERLARFPRPAIFAFLELTPSTGATLGISAEDVEHMIRDREYIEIHDPFLVRGHALFVEQAGEADAASPAPDRQKAWTAWMLAAHCFLPTFLKRVSLQAPFASPLPAQDEIFS